MTAVAKASSESLFKSIAYDSIVCSFEKRSFRIFIHHYNHF